MYDNERMYLFIGYCYWPRTAKRHVLDESQLVSSHRDGWMPRKNLHSPVSRGAFPIRAVPYAGFYHSVYTLAAAGVCLLL